MAKKTHAKIERSKDNYKELNRFIDEHEIDALKVTEYQCRCAGAIDIYPTNKKYFLLKTHKWGKYEDINELIKYIK